MNVMKGVILFLLLIMSALFTVMFIESMEMSREIELQMKIDEKLQR
jgi:hypothetical protein